MGMTPAVDPKRAVENAWQCVPTDVKGRVLKAMRDNGFRDSADFVEAAFDSECPISVESAQGEMERRIRTEIARLESLVQAGPGSENPNWNKYVMRLRTLQWAVGEVA